jgi:methylase of polypeptide subunit release factors
VGVRVPADVGALRDDLAEGYRSADVEAVLSPTARRALDREQAVPALRETTGRAEPAAVLLRLFVLGAEVTRAELDRALPRTGTDAAARAGLVAAAGAAPDDAVRALVDLQPCVVEDALGRAEWWLASDRGELATGGALRPDHVLGVGGASLTLAGATIRTPRRRTLDLGTGCGVQALLAARHSDAVVATDLSARALEFARFNAALAGVEGSRLELRQGSMLDPVRPPEPGRFRRLLARGLPAPDAKLFDLVVSNPPFVITPRGAGMPEYTYRDGGRSGDDLVRDLVLGLPEVLAPGGVAQLLGNWEHRRGVDWRQRVGEWVDRAGLDAWVVQREVQDPAEYAETWLRDGGTTPDRDPAAWRAGVEAWLDDLESRDVEAVGFGLVVLRRPERGGPTLRRLEELTGPVRQPLGEHLAAALAAHDWLAVRDDDELGGARLRPAPDVVEDRHHTPGEPEPTVVRLRQGAGFGRTVQLGPALAGLVGACDGEFAVGQIVGAMAALLDTPVELVAAEVMGPVRDLVRDGFLVPVEN